MFRCLCAATAPKPVELHTALYLSMLAAVWMATDPLRSGSYSSDAGECLRQQESRQITEGDSLQLQLLLVETPLSPTCLKGASLIQPVSQGAIQRFKRGQ